MLDDCNTKKRRNQHIAGFIPSKFKYKSGTLRMSSIIKFCNCGSWIDFFADREVQKLKIYRANFCGNRFCPMCAWRTAKKDALKIAVMMNYIEDEHDKAFIFVTLTAPNVKGENLKNEITKYNKAFKNLCKRDEIAKINKGYIRKLEVTYNQERDDYHPHFHCIFAVDKSYFTAEII